MTQRPTRSPDCSFLALLMAAGAACGPSAGVHHDDGATTQADEGAVSTGDGPGGSDAAVSTSAGPGDDTTGDTGAMPCPEGEYCFDVVDLPGGGLHFMAGDMDEDGRVEVFVGGARVLDWVDGELVVLGPAEPDVGPARFVAPSPVDGVTEFFAATTSVSGAMGGAYRIEAGQLVAYEYSDFAQMPPYGTGPGAVQGVLGPLDFDGDGRQDLMVYENYTPYAVTPDYLVSDIADTGHLLRFEGDVATVVGEPLPAQITGWHHVGSLHMAAADFDGDGRDEIVVPDDLFITTNPHDIDYDPEYYHLVTLRITDEGYEELWRAPAGLYGYELALQDLDGDGVLDLWVAGRQGVAVGRGWGDGTFDDPTPVDLSPYEPACIDPSSCYDGGVVVGVKAADFDADGDLELVVAIRPPDDEGAGAYDLVAVDDPLAGAHVRTLLPNAVEDWGYIPSTGTDTTIAIGDIDGNGCDDIVSSAEREDGEEVLRVLLFHR